ncbi:hypothetical protein BIV24_28505 [Streptomyces colonosanans]|uniref:Pilus assembly protein n=2 Tax=Streptomyces colonosanans TaxID=1428652 RepID=A0A1S2NV69_9ACTN|nr:hypothetical protein [Streptomyces colonosanans]OIJ85459.1 hypothetical protein BIV24_28505 [Streptomyces colonosanans]
MKNAALKAATNTKVYIGTWANTRVEKMKARRDQGQGAIEYVGITILVVAIIVALLNTDMGETIANKFTDKINEVLDK